MRRVLAKAIERGCDYLAIPDYRREIHTLLNRGESVHQLQRAIHGGQVAVS